MAPHLPRPHQRQRKMTKPWDTGATAVSAPLPGTEPGDVNDGVQRMYDYIALAPQNPTERAYAAADAFADSAINFAALVRQTKATPDEVINGAKHLLAQTLAAADIVIAQSVKKGHRNPKAGKAYDIGDDDGTPVEE